MVDISTAIFMVVLTNLSMVGEKNCSIISLFQYLSMAFGNHQSPSAHYDFCSSSYETHWLGLFGWGEYSSQGV